MWRIKRTDTNQEKVEHKKAQITLTGDSVKVLIDVDSSDKEAPKKVHIEGNAYDLSELFAALLKNCEGLEGVFENALLIHKNRQP